MEEIGKIFPEGIKKILFDPVFVSSHKSIQPATEGELHFSEKVDRKQTFLFVPVGSSVQDSLFKFFESESIDKVNCDRCNSKKNISIKKLMKDSKKIVVKISRKSLMNIYPENLIIFLKIFKYTTMLKQEKITEKIHLEEHLFFPSNYSKNVSFHCN